MKVELILGLISLPVTAGVVGTWLWGRRRERGNIASRLARLAPKAVPEQRPMLLKKPDPDAPENRFNFADMPGLQEVKAILAEASLEDQLYGFIAISIALLLLPITVALLFNLNVAICAVAGVILASVPLIIVKAKAEARRTKFCEQLPDAIDLMVAVLRSGHSVSQAVKAVAQDLPNPCGQEFEGVLHRINLGQSLADALLNSTRRFRSHELDLMQRAVSIQSDVGGSLAELLDKTNTTLRDRLKLARQLRVITAQSRLSAQIVGLLPIVLAVALNYMSPGYLQLLWDDKMGQTLLLVSIMLEIVGVFVMTKMSTMKV
ncbi:MAG TPA: type II secretion system F family protein [Trichormus sp.]|jgi:tight adherence protein B